MWSQHVRDWVQRGFAPENQIPGITQQEWRDKLLTFLPQVTASGAVDTIDWATFKTPQQLVLEDRRPANGSGYSSHPLDIGSASKKRKSTDLEVPDSDPLSPWKGGSNHRGLEERITGKNKSQNKKQKKGKAFQADMAEYSNSEALEKRRQRFGYVSPNSSLSAGDMPSTDQPTGPVVGTCQNLEKNYFRLTSAPKPEEVRPLPVLKKTLDLLCRKWKTEHNYTYACDQFKSLRQDLTVQHVKNDFVVRVYEVHARIALEQGDMGEYNQCQTQLRALYRMGLQGMRDEFAAYRILYFIYTCSRTDMNDVLADLTKAEKAGESVAHALQVRAALAGGNYIRFFRLYQATPYLGAFLLDKIVPRERLSALATICRGYVLFLRNSGVVG